MEYGWVRQWLPLDYAHESTSGYLNDRDINAGHKLTELSDAPCLVLLGAPGMGKTCEAEAWVRVLIAQGERVDLISVGRRADPQATLLSLLDDDNARAWLGSGAPWHLFIDGIDEGAGGVSAFEQTLKTFLDLAIQKGGDLAELRLRLLCRTVDWTVGLDRLVAEFWDKTEFLKLQIAPLSKSDVLSAVDMIVGDSGAAERFLTHIASTGAEALASRPVSLQFLANSHQSRGEIPSAQSELYRIGLTALVDESNDLRRKRARRGALTAAEKLTVASRIAAATAFSGVNRIWGGAGLPPAGSEAFALKEIAGGTEPSPPHSFPVSEADLRDALQTPLFVALGQDIYGWVHQTFVEYLAAHYLVAHSLTARQLYDFLSAADPDGRRGIVPQWREITAWVATLSHPFFDELIAREPDVLLQSDVAAASPADRERLVKAFLGQLNTGDLVDIYSGLRPLLGRLWHPRLATQLRAFVTNNKNDGFARRAAIDIIEATGLGELGQDLAQLALAETETLLVRTEAAYAVHKVGDDAAKAALAPLLRGNLTLDVDDELRGAALTSLWPEHLTLADLLQALTPEKQTNFIGTYHIFLRRLDVGKLSCEEALLALKWVGQSTEIPWELHGFRGAVANVFWGAAQQIGSASVRSAVAKLIKSGSRASLSWIFDTNSDEHGKWPDAFEPRLLLFKEVLAGDDDPRGSAREALYLARRLLRAEDLQDILSLLPSESNVEIVTGLVEVILALVGQRPPDEIAEVFNVAEQVPELKQALLNAYYIELDSVSAKWMREHFQQEQQAAEKTAERVAHAAVSDDRVLSILDSIEGGEYEEFWRLNLHLFVSNTGRFEHEYEFLSNLKATPGWARLKSSDRERIIDAAANYITHAKLHSVRWVGTGTQHRPAAAAFRALRLLFEERPDWFAAISPDTWGRWAVATVTFFDNDFASSEKAQLAIVAAAYEKAPVAIKRAIARLALSPKSKGLDTRLLQILRELFEPKLGDFLNDLRKRNLRLNSGTDLFAFLAEMDHGPIAQEIAERLRTLSDDDQAVLSSDDESLAAATAIQMRAGDTSTWQLVLEIGSNRPNFARSVWARYATDLLSLRAHPIPNISEDLLADAYIELEKLYPDRPQDEGARFLTPEDFTYNVQRGLLERLVQRGTADAVKQIARIQQSVPNATWLRYRVQEARRNFRNSTRASFAPSDVIPKIASMARQLPLRNELEAAQRAIALDRAPTGAELSVPTDISYVPEPIGEGDLPAVRPTRLLALATEWRSGKGGVSTINRELCCALAALGLDVCCVVLDATAEDIASASEAGVRLINCPLPIGINGSSRFLTLRPAHLGGFEPDAVLGHDHITGAAARQISQDLNTAYVHMLHTVPQESEAFKRRAGSEPRSPLYGPDKAAAQMALSREASLVVGVGPKIADYAATSLPGGPDVHEMMPGLDANLLQYRPDLTRLRRLQCLMSARMGDAPLKGAPLACDAIKASANGRDGPARPKLVLRGFTRENVEEEFGEIGNFGDYSACVEIRDYTDDLEVVHRDLQTSSLVLMPSLSEGFGLSAFEAIAAGVPVLLTFESGLSEFLLKAIDDGIVDATVKDTCIARVIDDDKAAIIDEWKTKVLAVMDDREAAFRKAEQLRIALRPHLTWRSAAERFVSALQTALTRN